MFRPLIVAVVVLTVAACEKPEDYLPKQPAQTAPAVPTAEAVTALRAAFQPCETAMDGAADAMGMLAAGGTITPKARDEISQARVVCDGAAAEIRTLALWGRLKDPCARAADARENVAAGALDLLEARNRPLAMSNLRDRIADQATASKTCAAEITVAEQAARG